MRKRVERVSEIRVGISTCLLGQKVRYDAGHKHDRYLTDILGAYFRFVPVCPELEVGMGVPREPVHLEGDVESPHMIGTKTREDWTGRMNQYSRARVKKRDLSTLRGYILKKDSPSCGMERVKLFNEKGMAERKAVGLYARALQEQYPLLPVEEEGRLNDARLRENFIVRVFAYDRLRNLFDGRFKRGDVVRFHAGHKYLILAHSPKHYTELGRLVAAIAKHNPSEFRDLYCQTFMEALAVKTSTKKNVNVLQHIMGFLKDKLTSAEKADINRVIEDYHRGLVPLVVPLTLVRHYVDKHQVEYIQDQVYLNPSPKELMLRNHV
jgi:uncharacterized protein YbgA (DUF1722 family)/uncharacterized protein YbbK (DUF523 family)